MPEPIEIPTNLHITPDRVDIIINAVVLSQQILEQACEQNGDNASFTSRMQCRIIDQILCDQDGGNHDGDE